MSKPSERQFERAVSVARTFRKFQDEYPGPDLSALAPHVLINDPPEVLSHNLRVLIQRPENPKTAFETLKAIAVMMLRERQSLPPDLADWIADVLDGKRRKPAKGGDTLGVRDLVIQFAIHFIVRQFGLSPMRNEIAAERSACDAVAEAWSMNYGTGHPALRITKPDRRWRE